MASMSDPLVQEALLKDPLVQDAMRRAGESALADPEVQRQVLEACREKFPELAAKAQGQIALWAHDPEVQRQARQYAGVAVDYARQGAARAGEEIFQLIEQGPAGIRLLAFGGGCASCANSSSILLGVLNPFTILTNSVQYVIASYQLVFALTTMLFEAPPEYVAMVPGVTDYQDLLLRKARFLSETAGRGLFYLFQGSLWLAFASLTDVVSLLIGLFLGLIAGVHISMHFGVMPQEIAQKMRAGAVAGYLPLPMSIDADLDVAPACDTPSVRPTPAELATVSREGPAIGWADEGPRAAVKEPTPAPSPRAAPEPEAPAAPPRTPTPELPSLAAAAAEQLPAAAAPTQASDPSFAAGGASPADIGEPPSPRPAAVSKPKCCVVS